MKIARLIINNFRNLKEVDIEPVGTVNLIIGENAQGKTNFLEAIYYLAHLTGFRTTRDLEMLNEGSDRFSIYSLYEHRNTRHEIIVSYSKRHGKSVLTDGKTAKKGFERPKVVLFTTDDLFLFTGSPIRRRQLLDRMLSQMSKERQKIVSDFYRILNQRNLQLRSGQVSDELLTAVNHTFAEIAAKLTILRLSLVRDIEREVNVFLSKMGEAFSVKFKYLLSYDLPESNLSLNTVKSSILERLQKERDTEFNRGCTIFGPHREDIRVYLNDKPVSIFASQGQQRTLVIATKIAELNTLGKETGVKPVLLLDEIFGELDQKRRKILVDTLETEPFQVFATSVDDASFGVVSGKIIMVRQGRISVKDG